MHDRTAMGVLTLEELGKPCFLTAAQDSKRTGRLIWVQKFKVGSAYGPEDCLHQSASCPTLNHGNGRVYQRSKKPAEPYPQFWCRRAKNPKACLYLNLGRGRINARKAGRELISDQEWNRPKILKATLVLLNVGDEFRGKLTLLLLSRLGKFKIRTVTVASILIQRAKRRRRDKLLIHVAEF